MKSNTATPFCKLCFRPLESFSFHQILHSEVPICYECFCSMEPIWDRFRVNGVPCLALFRYNEATRSALYRFKGCGDIELAPVFFGRVLDLLRFLYRGRILVPVPSSPEHDRKRGFNQVREMIRCFDFPVIEAISKPIEAKQSDLSAEERKRVGECLRWEGGSQLKGKKVLLVDDVYTTGSTVRACAKLLQDHGVKDLKILVMSKTEKKCRR